MELILDIKVKITEKFELAGGHTDIAMLPFVGEANGKYFCGKILNGGCDTQRISKSGDVSLSARYMLEGADYTGKDCRIFIENNTNSSGGLTPVIVTDSQALAEWETADLSSEIIPCDGGVNVKIFRTDVL